MKIRFLALFLVCAAPLASAQEDHPGLKSILTMAEWHRAGLDQLTPDQLGVIDAALIRQARAATAARQADLQAARAQTDFGAPSMPGAENKRGLLDRFGLPFFNDADWQTTPPLRAKVVAWESRNKFRLENGQIWEGFEAIPYELPGMEIEIRARPHGQFALAIDGKSTSLRVIRVR